MVDTGCGTIVAHSSQADRWLQNSRKSTLVMNGFSTSSSETAEIVGDLPAYVLNIVSPHTPNIDIDDDSSGMPTVGLPIIIKNVNTTGKARQNLLGLAYFNSLGFVTNEGLTGMHRTDPATREIQNIPFFYVPETASWHMATVIATSIEAAQEVGERIEIIYPLLTVHIIRMALAFDRHTTKIMQVCGGVMHIHIDEEQFMIDVDQINHETKFNRMEASSHLEPETFGNWVRWIYNCSERFNLKLYGELPICPSRQ